MDPKRAEQTRADDDVEETERYAEVDSDDVVEDAVEYFTDDDDAPTAADREPHDGPPPPNA